MKPFMDKDFLLETETAKHLFHDYSDPMPLVDYHCHISPKEIYEDRPTSRKYGWAARIRTAPISATTISGASCAPTARRRSISQATSRISRDS